MFRLFVKDTVEKIVQDVRNQSDRKREGNEWLASVQNQTLHFGWADMSCLSSFQPQLYTAIYGNTVYLSIYVV